MNAPIFYDTHAHVDYPDFASELPDLVERARAAGIEKIICIGTDDESSRRAIELSAAFPAIYAAVGWHPSDASRAPEDIRPLLRELAGKPKVVALGETGLDYYRLPTKNGTGSPADDEQIKAKQRAIFRQHLEVAAELGLNVVVHQRECLDDTISEMAQWAGRVRGVFHCFGGDVAALGRILEIGCIVSFTGILTFKNAQTVRDSLAAAPFGKFMLETDSPFLAPVPYRGKRCEPAYVREIALTAADVKQCSLDDLSETTCGTALWFFRGLSDWRFPGPSGHDH